MARKAYALDGRAIKHWLVENGLTQAELANALLLWWGGFYG